VWEVEMKTGPTFANPHVKVIKRDRPHSHESFAWFRLWAV